MVSIGTCIISLLNFYSAQEILLEGFLLFVLHPRCLEENLERLFPLRIKLDEYVSRLNLLPMFHLYLWVHLHLIVLEIIIKLLTFPHR